MKPSTFLSFEMQNGTEKLAEALVLRGFDAIVEGDFITLENGTDQDYRQLKLFLENIGVPVFWQERHVQLLVNRLSAGQVRRIVSAEGHEFPLSVPYYRFNWRNFANRRYGIRVNSINLDPFTAILVKSLNRAGIVTLSGCNGHHRCAPTFQLSGVYVGIWFSIVQQRYLKELNLHYRWRVEFQGKCQALITAHKGRNEKWDMMKVLSDCKQMVMKLDESAEEIRRWKKESFKRSMKVETDPLLEAGDLKALHEWMTRTAGVLPEEQPDAPCRTRDRRFNTRK